MRRGILPEACAIIFPGGDADPLCRPLRERIYTLPPDTVVYPGHGPVTTVGEEAAHNPFCSI